MVSLKMSAFSLECPSSLARVPCASAGRAPKDGRFLARSKAVPREKAGRFWSTPEFEIMAIFLGFRGHVGSSEGIQ
jgi:hypothetical protein